LFVLPSVNLRHPVRLLIANAGDRPVMPSFRLFRTDAREVRPDGFQLSPRLAPIPPNGTWLSTLTFLEVGVGDEPIDGQVQVSFDPDDVRVGVQYEYDQIVRSTVRLNAIRV
jgi:hypothetical protein